jgi:hypothetical protein
MATKIAQERDCYHTRCQKGMLRYAAWIDTFCLHGAASMVAAKEMVNWGIAVSISGVEMAEE